jgi:hypothetical protein
MLGSPTPEFEEVAILQAVGKAGHADLEHVVKGLRTEAAKLGCTAVVNVKVDQGDGTASGTGICARIPPSQPLAPPPRPGPPPPPVPSAAPPVTTSSTPTPPVEAPPLVDAGAGADASDP